MASSPADANEDAQPFSSADHHVDPHPHTDTAASSASDIVTKASTTQEAVPSNSDGPDSTGISSRREPITHYSSLSVDCVFPSSPALHTGSAQIIERDIGGEDDFWNIDLDFVWKPRTASSEQDKNGVGPLHVSVDEFLTLRLCLDAQPANVVLHRRGGEKIGQFSFPNGRDAAAAFLAALRLHVDTIPLEDAHNAGELFAIEKKQRMRRVAPLLAQNSTAGGLDDGDFSGLLGELSIRSPDADARATRRQVDNRGRRDAAEKDDFGMMILGHFARVTQVAREVGEEISTLLDEKKRRADLERKERERAARRRALDIYADIVASSDVERELPPRLTLDEPRGVAVGKDAWNKAFGEGGRIDDPVVMKQAIFSGGVEKNVRAQVWPFILGFFPWESTRSERDEIVVKKGEEFDSLKQKWASLQGDAHSEDAESLAKDEDALSKDRRKRVSKAHAVYLETEEQIAKDIVRTDRSVSLYEQDGAPATLVMGALLNVYALYDNRITYCQGMSDFLSPILYVIGVDNESLAFWCFEALMRRIEGNFRVDQSGMRAQLSKLKHLIETMDKDLAVLFEKSDPDYYSCFRWILVRFKREFPFESTARLWEVLWTRQVGDDDLHIFVAAALLIAHRRQLLSLPEGAFDSMLRYVNDMSMRIDVDFALREGELLYRKFGDVAAVTS